MLLEDVKEYYAQEKKDTCNIRKAFDYRGTSFLKGVVFHSLNRPCPIDGEMAGFDALIFRLFDYSEPASFFFRGTILYSSMPFFPIQNVLPVFGGGM